MATDTNTDPPPAQWPDPYWTTQTGYGSFMLRLGRVRIACTAKCCTAK